MLETWVWSLGWEDPLEKEMSTHSSILAWEIPWTEEPDRLEFMRSQKVGLNWTMTTNLPSVQFSSVQFISVAQSYPTLCDPMNCSMPGLPVHHHLPEFTQTHVHRVRDAIQPSSHLILSRPFSSCPQSLPASESFPMSQLFTWGGQSTGVSALASFLPKKSQGW